MSDSEHIDYLEGEILRLENKVLCRDREIDELYEIEMGDYNESVEFNLGGR